MRTIRKKIKWDGYEGQEMFHESYDNYQEFYDTLMKRQNNLPYNRTLSHVFNDHSRSWMGVNSIDEAKNLFFNGWDTPLEEIKRQTTTNLKSIERMPKRRAFNDVTGYQPIVSNALMGLPKSMINVRQEKVGSRVLRFLIMIDRGCGNDTQTIIKKMSKILAHIASLERSGKYRCRLEIAFAAWGGEYRRREINTSGSILVKSEHQLFDIKRLCFPIVHPAMLRLLMFAWEESLPLPYDKYIEGGYGRSFEYWSERQKEQYKDSIRENGEKILVVDLHTDIEDMLKDF